MKKLLTLAALVGAISAGFAACGGAGITEAQSGPAGPQGPAGVSGYEVVTKTATLGPRGLTTTSVTCSSGKVPLAGGWDFVSISAVVMTNKPEGAGWSFGINNQGTVALPVSFYVVCATAN